MILLRALCEVNESGCRHLNCHRYPSSIIYSPGSNKVSKNLSHLPGLNINLKVNNNDMNVRVFYNRRTLFRNLRVRNLYECSGNGVNISFSNEIIGGIYN